jgi:hypothetical protein
LDTAKNELTRSEEIHAKGFDMTSNLKSVSFANMSPEQVEAEYKRIKVGVKTLDDAVLQLGSL